MKILYVKVTKRSAFNVWYNDYVSNIFCVTQANHWFGIWQLADEFGNRWDIYIDKYNSDVVELADENKNDYILSNDVFVHEI